MKLVVFGCPWGHLLRNIQITSKFHRYFGSPGGPEMRNFFKIGKNLNFRSISWKMTNFIVFSWKTSILVVFRVLSPRGPLKTIGISKEYVGLGEAGPRNRKIGYFHENGWFFLKFGQNRWFSWKIRFFPSLRAPVTKHTKTCRFLVILAPPAAKKCFFL